jgi:protein-S-isoprenylcysteine O-methyltransferase Ste14
MPAGSLFKYILLGGLIIAEVIRLPHRLQNERARRQGRIIRHRVTPLAIFLDVLAYAGLGAVPVLYVFSPWLDWADYPLPLWVGAIGTALLAGVLWLIRQAHVDLGDNWSPIMEVKQGQALVTRGLYRSIRHPIYAAMWLWAFAQVLLLPNWIAGPAGLVLFLPLYLHRVGREEQLLLEHFGEPYHRYMQQTGRLIPRWREVAKPQTAQDKARHFDPS